LVNVAILTIGIILSFQNPSYYSEIIQTETSEWGKGAIVDFVESTNGACPNNFEKVTGVFPGTRAYCDPLFGDPVVGTCEENDKEGANIAPLQS
jgi:hypothetical protein